jgi:hypothetical protein
MKTYILFIFGMFDDHEDIEYFCTEVLAESKVIESVRFVIENSQNIIVIFDSEFDHKNISNELFGLLTNDNIKFYFIFDRENLVTAHLPIEVKDFIFKPANPNHIVRVEYEKTSPILDLDQVLEKIEESGIDSLTPEEKKFLDNFDN